MTSGSRAAHGTSIAFSAFEVGNALAGLSGSFHTLKRKGNAYWYFSYREPGAERSPVVYIGPDTEQVRLSPRFFAAPVFPQKVDKLFSGEFIITPSDGGACAVSGLSYPTKFNLASTFELPFNEEWFGVPPGAPHGQVPKLGVLHPSLMRRARAAMEDKEFHRKSMNLLLGR